MKAIVKIEYIQLWLNTRDEVITWLTRAGCRGIKIQQRGIDFIQKNSRRGHIPLGEVAVRNIGTGWIWKETGRSFSREFGDMEGGGQEIEVEYLKEQRNNQQEVDEFLTRAGCSGIKRDRWGALLEFRQPDGYLMTPASGAVLVHRIGGGAILAYSEDNLAIMYGIHV